MDQFKANCQHALLSFLDATALPSSLSNVDPALLPITWSEVRAITETTPASPLLKLTCLPQDNFSMPSGPSPRHLHHDRAIVLQTLTLSLFNPLLSNLMREPQNVKFHSISLSQKFVSLALARHQGGGGAPKVPGAAELLQLAGFEEGKRGVDGEEGRLVWFSAHSARGQQSDASERRRCLSAALDVVGELEEAIKQALMPARTDSASAGPAASALFISLPPRSYVAQDDDDDNDAIPRSKEQAVKKPSATAMPPRQNSSSHPSMPLISPAERKRQEDEKRRAELQEQLQRDRINFQLKRAEEERLKELAAQDLAEGESLKEVASVTIHHSGRLRNSFFAAEEIIIRRMRAHRYVKNCECFAGSSPVPGSSSRAAVATDEHSASESSSHHQQTGGGLDPSMNLEVHWHNRTTPNMLYSYLAHLTPDGTRVIHVGEEYGYQYNGVPNTANFGKTVLISQKAVEIDGKLVTCATPDEVVNCCHYCKKNFNQIWR